MINLKKIYSELYAQIDLEKVLQHYDLQFKTSSGKHGKELVLRCPFHDDLSPSFCFNQKTGFWVCYVCGGGNFFTFIKRMEKLPSVFDAVTYIKNKIKYKDEVKNNSFEYFDNIFFEKEKAKDVEGQEVIPKLKEIRLPKCVPADEYFEITKKRVKLEDIKKWNLMYCVEPKDKYEEKYRGRLIIPIYFENKLVTFAARDMTGRSEQWNQIKKEIRKNKYDKDKIRELTEQYECKKILYPFGAPTSYIFFNWDKAVKNKKYVIVVEGAFDAIRLDEYGFNVIAILSCHVNDYRLNLLLDTFDEIYIALDDDYKVNAGGEKENPGQEAAKKLLKRMGDFKAYNVVVGEGKDPDELTKEEFQSCLDNSKKFDFSKYI